MRKLSVLFLLAGLALVLAAALQQGGMGLSTDAFSNGSNAFTADTLNPPTSLSATGGSSISLSWTATSDTYASGYHVLRSTTSGGSYTQIAQVTPRTTTTYVDSPGAGAYYYVVRAYYQNWESVDSNEATAGVSTPTPTRTPTSTPTRTPTSTPTATPTSTPTATPTPTNTGFANCTADAAVTTNSGDNNGFEVTPGNACADDANSAQDVNSGTGSPDTCASTSKDRHLFYNYGFSLPSGSVINGIRVRLDAWADNTSQSPFMCVELSWNGGATWTAAKSTPNLTASQATYILGTASDTWGRTWATGDFSNANFRLRITDVSGFNGRDFFLDWAAVEVTYTPP